MMRPLRILTLSSPFLWSLIATAPAQAGLIATLDSSGYLQPATAVYINAGDGTAPTDLYTPGVVNWTLTSNTTGFNIPTYFTTFCIQLTQNITPGSSATYTTVTPDIAGAPIPGQGMGDNAAAGIELLWGAFFTSIASPPPTYTPNEAAAAFQLAIWKIENDWATKDVESTDFTTGQFQATANGLGDDAAKAISLASSWLSALATAPQNYTPATDLYALESPTYQDQIMAIPSVSAVPVPSTVSLAVMAILSLFGYRQIGRRFSASHA